MEKLSERKEQFLGKVLGANILEMDQSIGNIEEVKRTKQSSP